jgi:uncharacterized protein YyaL (SSP411 family)
MMVTLLFAAVLVSPQGRAYPAAEQEPDTEAAEPVTGPEPPSSEEASPETTREARPPAVAWRTWSEHTLEVAREVDRPIFLFLTNPWNTMGRIMDANTFPDPRVWATLRDLFIPVRVDVDRRPDILERFGGGGLPSVAIVMPSGESLYLRSPRGSYVRAAGTYFSAEDLYHYLRSIADYYRDNRALLDIKIDDIVKRFQREENTASAPLDYEVVETVFSALNERFDRTHAGFGLTPKVPDAQALLLCWHVARMQGDKDARDMGLRTLRAIWDSPLHDEVEGGVFRFAMDRDWGSPRYEKVLDVNARLLESMAEGLLATGERWLDKAVREQADFLIERFVHPQGGLMRAQGAGDPFGSYFQLSRRKRSRAEPPPLHPLRIVSWNARAASALLRAHVATGEVRYREVALEVLNFLLKTCKTGSRGMAHYYDGRAQMLGLLVDQIATARALLDAYAVMGQSLYLLEAGNLITAVRGLYRHESSPTFIDRFQDPRLRGALRRPDRDLIENAELAMVMLELSALTDDDLLAGEAQQVLETFADQASLFGSYGAPLARAVDLALRSPVKLVVRRGEDPERALALARQAARLRHRWVVVDWYEARASVLRPDPEERALLEEAGGTAALLVENGERIGPLYTPKEIMEAAAAWRPQLPVSTTPTPAESPEEPPPSRHPVPQSRPSGDRG